MGRVEISKAEQCSECKRLMKSSVYEYHCDLCGKEMKEEEEYNNVLRVTLFQDDYDKNESRMYCSWACCLTELKSWYFSSGKDRLGHMISIDHLLDVNFEGFFNMIKDIDIKTKKKL